MKPQSNFSRRPKKVSKSSGSGEIRIIGGRWRGRKLKVHNSEGLRPTTDRVKETVFNWLMTDVRGAKVLDCFAGAGSLGFEAASRGAEHVVAIEKDKQAAAQLKKNCEVLNAREKIQVFAGDFFQQVQKLGSPFDIIFIDPPFHKNMLEKTLTSLFQQNAIADGTLLYIEQESNDVNNLVAPEGWQFEMLKDKKAGQVSARLFQVSKLN